MIRTRTPTAHAVSVPADAGFIAQGLKARGMGTLGLLCGLAILALAGCAEPPAAAASSQTRSDSATLDACRRRANEIYDHQNRATIFAAHSGLNNPSSGAYVTGQTDRGLSARFAQEQLIRECVRNAGGAAEASPPAPGAGPAQDATPASLAPAAAPKR